MAIHHDLGAKGEELAAEWLKKKGYKIQHRNWRVSTLEIDIIAEKEGCLHFVEVKSRNHSPFGHPEDGVGRQKFKALQRAADVYMQMHHRPAWIQYDVLAITFFRDKEPEFFLLEDVFL
jgi:putative endonuclease